MHSKVIIASLILGLAVGFASGVKNSTNVAQSLVKDETCDVIEPVGQALRTAQPKRAAANTTVRPDLFITRSRAGSVSSGGANWYTFTAPFDGRFWFQSSNTNMDPIAEIYLGLGTNYGTVSPDDGNRDDISSTDRNFRFALDMTCGQTRYIRVRDYYNRAGSYTLAASHDHVYDYRTAYYNSTKHREFCSCGENHLVTLNVDDEMSGHGRDMVHCSVCDRWITLTQSGHTHSYSWCSYKDQNYHRRICECGYNYSTSHTFDAVYNVGDYQVKHCSGCNAWVEIYSPHVHSYTSSYETYNNGMHKAVCSCGQYVLQQHTFSEYIEIGHGHNGMIRCSKCDAYVEPDVLTTSNSSSGYIEANNAKWHVFKPESAGSYTFRLTGTTSYTYMEFYLGDYPTSMITSFTTENIGVVSHTRTVNENQWVFIRVRGNNWSATNYTLSVTPAHTHVYNQLVDYGNAQNHKLVCSCGAYITQSHEYNSYVSSNNAYHTMACACGRTYSSEHTFNSFAPYGHGHNDMIHCSTCNNNVECFSLNENDYTHSVSAGDANWYFFEPAVSGTYIFESTGSYDTYCDLYVGDYPTTITDYNDDDGIGNNFKLSHYLEAGERAFIRVREYDWEYAEYTISVSLEVPVPQPNPTAEWTIMIYMCEANLPTDLSISRILDVPGQPSDVNIIIELGGTYNSNEIKRYHVRNQQLVLDETLYAQNSNQHMGDESTFESFLFWGLEYYPARKTGVILWDHGQGINGVCHDPNDWTGEYDAHSDEIYDSLTVSETTTAFTNAFNYFDIDKLEFIGYDACLMQVQDVADFNSDFFKYMVASEEEAVDYMWVYDGWLDCVYDGEGTETILKEIVDSMVFENSQYQYTWEQTLSVLDLSKMATYRQKFENLADTAINFIFNNNSLTDDQVWEYYYHFIDLASQRSHQYGNQLSTEWSLYGTNDVYDFLNYLCEDEIFGDELEDAAADLMYFMYPNKIMSSDPNVGEDEAATFGPNARRTLVLYKRSNYVRLGQWNCRSHGLAMHVWSEEPQIYPASETRFVKWRQLFFDYRYYQYNEAN